MGKSIQDYRAAIGLFYCKKRKTFIFFDPKFDSYSDILIINLRCCFLIFSLSTLQSVNPSIDIVFLLFELDFILIIGNIETNPGPEVNYYESNTPSLDESITIENYVSICSLNTRSIRNKLDFVNNFFDEFDIIALSKTHIDPKFSDDDSCVEFKL